jgi:hypothetical protein
MAHVLGETYEIWLWFFGGWTLKIFSRLSAKSYQWRKPRIETDRQDLHIVLTVELYGTLKFQFSHLCVFKEQKMKMKRQRSQGEQFRRLFADIDEEPINCKCIHSNRL